MVALKLVDDVLSAPGFFEPVRISPPSRGEAVDTISLPGGSRFFSVLVQPSLYSKPRINGQFHPLDFEFLFDNLGIYHLRIEAHGHGTTVAVAVIEVHLERPG